jgi:hypothetical protein
VEWTLGAHFVSEVYPSGRVVFISYGVKQPIVTGSTPHLGKCGEVRGTRVLFIFALVNVDKLKGIYR